MKPWNIALLGLIALASAGCRTDPAVPILERELRLKEDEIYRLRAILDGATDSGSSCSNRVVSDTRAMPADESRPTSRRGRRGSGSANGMAPPSVNLPSSGSEKVPDILNTPGVPDVPPDIQGPSKPRPPRDESSDGASGPMLERNGDSVTTRPGRITMASQSGSAQSFTPSGDSRRVASIVLNRMLTGGVSEQPGEGDQGVLVVVEPRDRSGRPVDAPAEMSVVVIDPALEGNAARLARWDFTPEETAAMFRRAGNSPSIHLTMAWPENPPVHNKLHLFVRYVTADGRKLQADQPIEVALPGDSTARWDRSDGPMTRPSPERDFIRTPRIAARGGEPAPHKPAWSPDRR